ncbi:MAG: ThuA domain-containing protein [Verrucomicrobiota bacterium]
MIPPSSPLKRRFSALAAPVVAIASLALIILAIVGCGESPTPDSTVVPAKIVIVAGPPSHPSGMHEFYAGSILLKNALNNESGLPLTVEVVRNGWPEDESIFDDVDAVIIYSDGRSKHPVNGHEAKMDEMIQQGVGLMCMHYGVDVPAGDQGEYFKKWIGGHYEDGYSVNPHWTAEVALDESHAISNGIPGFTANDEWYYNMRFADGEVGHILTAVPTAKSINRYLSWTKEGKAGLGERQTMMWAVDRSDGGRGVGFTGGHWHRNWALDDFRKVVLNAIVWVSGIEVPENGVASETISEAQLNENLDEKEEMVHVGLPSVADLWQTPAPEKEINSPKKPKAKAKEKAKKQ